MDIQEFIFKHDILGLSVGTIIGLSVKDFIQTFTNIVIEPTINKYITSNIQSDIFPVNTVSVVLSSFIQLITLIVLIFLAMKYIFNPMFKEYRTEIENKERKEKLEEKKWKEKVVALLEKMVVYPNRPFMG